MIEPPKVYVVLVNYRSWQDTVECLESLFKLSYNNFTVVVVDNDSQNNSIDYLKSWARGEAILTFDQNFYNSTNIESSSIKKPVPYRHIRAEDLNSPIPSNSRFNIVESKSNLGFAGGNNIGTQIALENNADYIWFLNNDTVVPKDALSHLVNHSELAKHSGLRLGILGAKLLYYHQPKLIQAVVGRFKPLYASTEHIGLNQPSSSVFDKLQLGSNNYIVGASMFVSTDFIKDVGMMSEEYFLYYEELDWVKRAQIKKYKIDTCLNAIVYHKEGATIGGSIKDNNNKSELSDYYSIRNRLIITKKYYRRYLPTVYLSLIFVILNRLRRRQFQRVPMLIRIILQTLK